MKRYSFLVVVADIFSAVLSLIVHAHISKGMQTVGYVFDVRISTFFRVKKKTTNNLFVVVFLILFDFGSMSNSNLLAIV